MQDNKTLINKKNISGIVLKSTGNVITVKAEEGFIIHCKVKGNFRIKNIKNTSPVAVGDRVILDVEENNEYGIIKEIEVRKNYIIRKSTNLSRQSHIIAANIDQAFLIITLKFPETSAEFIDRYLVSAEAFRIPVILIFNKIDIYDDIINAKLDKIIDTYTKAKYLCIKTSFILNINIEFIKQKIENKITLISGLSGVGKSLLINKIDPNLSIKTGEISAYHKSGKHTTTFTEMYALSDGGYIIDTPGIRGFGIIDINKEELYHFFPEIFNHSRNCKFHNCLHIKEPGCAVLKALNEGLISQSRYNSYYSLFHDENEKYR